MTQYARPSVDNLINNLPGVLKSSRQFVPWNVEAGGRKVPVKADGSPWGSYKDPNCWRTFENAIDLLDRRRAFGVGLALPSPQQVETLPEFNLIAGLVAFDADAKRSSIATPYHVPAHISGYIRSVQSYSEFSPSLKGLRALAFGTLPTKQQSITKHFGDGTELSLFRGGWVTLSGLPCADSPPMIEYRQDVLDHLVEELWPDLKAGMAAGAHKTVSHFTPPAYFGENFVLDWARTASEGRIRQFIQGYNRTPRQAELMRANWELKRGWNHGDTPDSSMYTKRIVEEALWLQPLFGWALQDVIDIVITFCKKNRLQWSYGRAKKQLTDGQRFILSKTRQPRAYESRDGSSLLDQPPQQDTPTLTCYGAQIIREQNSTAETSLTGRLVNDLHMVAPPRLPDSFSPSAPPKEPAKLSGDFRYKSGPRDAVLKAINKHASWVRVKTIAAETGKSAEAVRKQLERLKKVGLVDCDGKGHYRKHRERKARKLRPCSSKPIPTCQGTNKERKTLTRSELSKRGWPKELIDKSFPEAGKDYTEKEFLCPWRGRVVKTRLYRVSRIKAFELQPWFEIERAKTLRRPVCASVQHRNPRSRKWLDFMTQVPHDRK